VDDKPHLLAAYLCTPLVTFPIAELKDRQHLKGMTVAEFGSGNYPLDMVPYKKDGKDYIVMANSMLPLLTFDPADIPKQKAITEEVDGYLAGLQYTPRAGSGIQQLDGFNQDFVIALQRVPSGKLDLVPIPIRRL
jgi:hypothetical protein